MSKRENPDVLEVLGYSQGDPVVVEGEDGHYTVLMNDDLIVPAPGEEDIQREIDLAKLVRAAVDNGEKYVNSRREDRANVWGPVYIMTAFFLGAGIASLIFWAFSNGYIGGGKMPWG